MNGTAATVIACPDDKRFVRLRFARVIASTGLAVRVHHQGVEAWLPRLVVRQYPTRGWWGDLDVLESFARKTGIYQAEPVPR